MFQNTDEGNGNLWQLQRFHSCNSGNSQRSVPRTVSDFKLPTEDKCKGIAGNRRVRRTGHGCDMFLFAMQLVPDETRIRNA